MAIERILYMYKGDRCASCGKTLNELIRRYGTAKGQFDMNHTVPAKKDPDYSNLIRQKTLTSKQLDEVDKCVLLCKECHTALHGQNIFMEVDAQLEAEGTVVIHRLTCQVIRDTEKGEDQLFHEAVPLLHLLRVKSGRQTVIHSCLQLTENDLFDRLVSATKSNDELRIETLDGFCLYRATKLNDEEFDFSQSAHFRGSHVHVHGTLSDAGKFDAFIRNGQMLLLSHIGPGLGSIRTSGRRNYGSTPPAEDFQIESPDPEILNSKPIDFGPHVVVTRAQVIVPPA